MYISVFALMSPVGTVIGLHVTDLLSLNNPFQAGLLGILQAMAAGTLLYVVFFELLGKERHKDTAPLLLLFFTVLGFLTILGLEFIPGHSHDHHVGHDHAEHGLYEHVSEQYDHHDEHGHDEHGHDDHGHDDHGHDDHGHDDHGGHDEQPTVTEDHDHVHGR